MSDQEYLIDEPIRMKAKKFPVVEIFGPTIQGEGPDQGLPVYFIRFGGCDYRCEWCDSPFAVLPHLVRNAERLTQAEITSRLWHLPEGPGTIVLSGGNPALHDLGDLCDEMQALGARVSVETQGTVFKRWLFGVNQVVVSPKPPSSGMKQTMLNLRLFMEKLRPDSAVLKIVVFDRTDYEWARRVHEDFHDFKMFLSAGNYAGATVGNPARVDSRSNKEVADQLIEQGRWLANQVMVDPHMKDVRVQMQQHVLYWGNERGR